MTSSIFSTRFQKLQKTLHPTEAILLSHSSDVHYFSGFEFLVPEEREAFLLVTHDKVVLIHTSFSPLPQNNLLLFLARCQPVFLKKHIQQIREKTPFKTLKIDQESLFVDEYLSIGEIPNLKIQKLDKNIVWEIRMIKDELETQAMKEAGKIAILAFEKINRKIKAGMTEKDLSNLLEKTMQELGSQKPAFPTIVTFGKNTPDAHHQPTSKILEKEMPVLIDFGATVRGYRSDITRSFWFGKNPPEKYLEIETIVKKAYDLAIEKLKTQFEIEELTILKERNSVGMKNVRTSQTSKSPTLTARDIDKATRTYITQAGYSTNFNHTTGHGLGLEIHEQPSVSWSGELKLCPGMVITVEPGIYIWGEFGIRYENTILILQKKSP